MSLTSLMILIDEKFDLPVNAQLVITGLPDYKKGDGEPWLASGDRKFSFGICRYVGFSTVK